MTHYKPSEPYQAAFAANFGPRANVIVIGSIPVDATQFKVNLMNSKTDDIHFHLNPRFKDGLVVRNTKRDGSWGRQESHTPLMPFQPGQSFVIEIKNEGDALTVHVNEKKLFSYAHRLPFNEIDVLVVGGDVNLTCIEF
ncbi:galectin-4-like [Dendropsophus ebraccatus]|uniref:galectin-4-like n=1 Tax=Dendropsophus ebraccatus TaxID=150705 RepID=UPI003831B9B1